MITSGITMACSYSTPGTTHIPACRVNGNDNITDYLSPVVTTLYHDTYWARGFGCNDITEGHDILQTADGGFIVAGDNYHCDYRWYDAYVLKLDQYGNVEWKNSYGDHSVIEDSSRIAEIKSGGYAIYSDYVPLNTSVSDFWIFKIDSSGNKVWEKFIEAFFYDEMNDMQATSDGGFILAGYKTSQDLGGWNFYSNIWVIKLNSSGEIEWQKLYGNSNTYNAANTIYELPEGGYIIAGVENGTSTSSDGNMWVAKLSATGDVLWETKYTGYSGRANNIRPANDGGFIITGFVYDPYPGTEHYDIWTKKIGATGTTIWDKFFNTGDDDIGYSAWQNSSGGYTVVGYGQIASNNFDAWIMTLDSSGNTLTSVLLGGSSNDFVFSAAPTSNGNIVLTGTSNSLGGSTERNMWVAVTDPTGNCSGCFR